MVIIKTPKEIELMKKGGKILASILKEVAGQVKPGIDTKYLNDLAEKLILRSGAFPSFKGYHRFPTGLCTSINSEVVHSPALPKKILHEGDIIGLDLGLKYPAKNGLFVDMALTLPIGRISNKAKKLIKVTKKALEIGLKNVKPGNATSDIGYAIQKYVEARGFSVVRDLSGHGVGKKVHEEPKIPNFGLPGKGEILKEGVTLAIEPMVNCGSYKVKTLKDGFTVVTFDGSLSAHFEHTVAVTKEGCEILTSL